jgi:hypothetical protein
MIIEKSDHSSLYMIYIYAYVLYPLLLTVDIMIASPHDIVQGDMARIQFVSSARCSPKLLLGFYGCSSSPNSVFHGVWPIHTVANPIINRPFFSTMTWEVVINVIPIIPLLGVYQIHKPLLGMCEWRFHAIFGFAKNGLTNLTGFPINRGKKKIVYLMFGQFLDGWVPTRLPILDGSQLYLAFGWVYHIISIQGPSKIEPQNLVLVHRRGTASMARRHRWTRPRLRASGAVDETRIQLKHVKTG